jgi:hypothetical protein
MHQERAVKMSQTTAGARGLPMVGEAIHPDWFNHPLIAEAIKRGGGDPLVVLEKAHNAIREFDRVGGCRTFGEAYKKRVDHFYDKEHDALARLGYSEDQINEIRAVSVEKPDNAMTPEGQAVLRAKIRELHALGWPARTIMRHTGLRRTSVNEHLWRAGLTGTMTPKQIALAEAAIEHGPAAAAKQFGLSCASAIRYRDSLLSRRAMEAERVAA